MIIDHFATSLDILIAPYSSILYFNLFPFTIDHLHFLLRLLKQMRAHSLTHNASIMLKNVLHTWIKYLNEVKHMFQKIPKIQMQIRYLKTIPSLLAKSTKKLSCFDCKVSSASFLQEFYFIRKLPRFNKQTLSPLIQGKLPWYVTT